MPIEFVVDTLIHECIMRSHELSNEDAKQELLEAIAIALSELVKEARDIRGQLEEMADQRSSEGESKP